MVDVERVVSVKIYDELIVEEMVIGFIGRQADVLMAMGIVIPPLKILYSSN